MLVLINKIAMLSDLGSFASGTSAPLGSTNTRFLSNVALPNIFFTIKGFAFGSKAFKHFVFT